MMLLSKTYEVITPESAEDGAVDRSGFEFEREPFSFSELVRALEDYSHVNDSTFGDHTWAISEPEINWRTGAETVYSLHFVGPESKRKYWLRALRNRFRPKVEPRNRGQMALEGI
jgi:hypothetical protein